jgi:hypothetical protein
MKKHSTYLTILLLNLIAFAPLSATAQTWPGLWTVVLSPAEGGTKTAISLTNSGEIATGFTFDSATWGTGFFGGVPVAASGFFGAPANAWTFATTNFPFSTFGYAQNVTTGLTKDFTSLIFVNINAGGVGIQVEWDGLLTGTTGDEIRFVFDPSPAQLVIDLAFDNFNPGTYNSTFSSTSPNYNMEIVPEPSTYALLALAAAGLGGYVLRRRRR